MDQAEESLNSTNGDIIRDALYKRDRHINLKIYLMVVLREEQKEQKFVGLGKVLRKGLLSVRLDWATQMENSRRVTPRVCS